MENPKILIVDDMPANIYSMEMLLSQLKVSTVAAHSGSEALKLTLSERFALILMDVNMPELDGYETASLIRSNDHTKNVPIIFVTATLVDREHTFKGYESGAVDYICKPVDPFILRSKVKVFSELFRLRELEKSALLVREQEKREQERACLLEQENKKMMTILDNLPIGIAQAEAPSGRMVYTNKTHDTILRHETKLANRLEDYESYPYCHHDGRPYDAKELPIIRALHGDLVREEEMVYKFEDGTRTILLVSGIPIKNLDGSVCSAICAFFDISKRIMLEEELYQTRKLESLGSLTGGIAHEFNNIVHSLVNCVHIARHENRDDSLDEVLQRMENACNQASKITSNMLLFSRKQPLIKRRCDLVTILHQAIDMVTPLFGQLLQLKTKVNIDSAILMADPELIIQAITNVLINARDAMDGKGQVLIEIGEHSSRRYSKESSNEVETKGYAITITDSGPGIRPEDIKRIFDPFFTTKDPGKGTGLGLSTVYNILNKHSGNITVKSSEKGTTFTLFFPDLNEKVQFAPESYTAPEAEDIMAIEGLSIIVVEDNVDSRQLLASYLGRLKCKVREFETAEDALYAIESSEHRFDAGIFDITLPGMNGIELAEQLESKEICDTYMFMTGYSSVDNDVYSSLVERGHRVMLKPFKHEVLVKVLSKLIENKNRRVA